MDLSNEIQPANNARGNNTVPNQLKQGGESANTVHGGFVNSKMPSMQARAKLERMLRELTAKIVENDAEFKLRMVALEGEGAKRAVLMGEKYSAVSKAANKTLILAIESNDDKALEAACEILDAFHKLMQLIVEHLKRNGEISKFVIKNIEKSGNISCIVNKTILDLAKQENKVSSTVEIDELDDDKGDEKIDAPSPFSS